MENVRIMEFVIVMLAGPPLIALKRPVLKTAMKEAFAQMENVFAEKDLMAYRVKK